MQGPPRILVWCVDQQAASASLGAMARGVAGRASAARMLCGLAPFLLLLVAMLPVGERVDALSFPKKKPSAPEGGMPADAKSAKSGDDANALFIEGNVLLQEGDLPNAVLKYRAALEADPEHADAWTNMGNAMSQAIPYSDNQKKSLFVEAVKSYRKAVEIHPQHCEAYFNMGVLYHSHGRLDLSIPAYEKALEIEPLHFDAISNLGSAKHKQGDLDGAVDMYQRAIEILEQGQGDTEQASSEGLSLLYYLLGQSLSALPAGRCAGAPCPEHAANKFRTALRHNPDNEEAKHALSALVSDPSTTTASAAYVKSLFDEYANTFDHSLLNGLGYKAPSLLHERVKAVVEERSIPKFATLFDAGCGTGLCGPLFRDMASTLVGVDLSPEMIRKASERHVYDELLEGDIAEALSAYSGDGKSEKGAIGFTLAADVFVYIGDLREIFAASIAALSPGGLFAFTVERLDDVAESARLLEANPVSEAPVSQEDYDKGWKLRFTGRFAHSRPYIVGLAEQYGFEVLVHENIVPRRDNGVDIQGHLVVLQKPN